MNNNGRPKELHTVDGRQMTVDEVAGMLGLTRRALWTRRSAMGGISYQAIVDMYRANMLGSRNDRWERHLVDGEWITVEEAARRCGCATASIQHWRGRHKDARGNRPTLKEAMDHFMKIKTGEQPRWPGMKPKKHRVDGHWMTIAEAAEKYKLSENSLRLYMHRHHSTLNSAVRGLEDRRKQAAVRAILAILKENRP